MPMRGGRLVGDIAAKRARGHGDIDAAAATPRVGAIALGRLAVKFTEYSRRALSAAHFCA